MSKFHQSPTRYISEVTLRVMDLDKSIKYYNEVLGFDIIIKDSERVVLGFTNNPLITLIQAKNKKDINAAGLYHIAFLVKSRNDLANWLYYHLKNNTPLSGASHHGVSEAIYLEDIDGNGIEVYTDLDFSNWTWLGGNIDMTTQRLDINNLLKDVTKPTNKLPEETIIGHLHLKVLDIEESNLFYNILGFETVLKLPTAAFLSDNKYHHHLGMNVWHTRKGRHHLNDNADLDSFTILYPTENDRNIVLEKLKLSGFNYEITNNKVILRDLNNIKIILDL